MSFRTGLLSPVFPVANRVRTYLRFVTLRQRFRRTFRSRTMADAFGEIYRQGAWGRAEGENFFSGSGSTVEFSAAYATFVNDFVEAHKVSQIVDLGCGDFRVGRLINTSERVHYTGMDIVAELISHNQAKYASPFVRFRCGNAISDELPDGDLCLVRQVLQHLSNSQITAILNRCSKYRYVLVTEDVYNGPGGQPNIDKPAGWDTRTYSKSGVYVDLMPFNFAARTVLEIPTQMNTVLRTLLIVNPLSNTG